MRKKMYKAGKSWMVAAIAVGMIAAPITADIVGISSIQEGMTVHAQPTTTEPDTTYSAPPLFSSSVKASGTFGTAKWYISMDGTLHIGTGEFAAVANRGDSWTTSDDSPWYTYADKINKIVFDGDVVANADSHDLFGGLNQVTSIEGLNKLDTHQVTNMRYMFVRMFSLTSLDLSNFDTSQVTDMSGMFYGMSILTSLDLSGFDTSKVAFMNNMFTDMPKLNQITFGANFDTFSAGSDSAVLPNVAGIQQWRQVGSGTVDNPAGEFRNSATIDTTEPVVADTYVLGTYTVADFWKPNTANTYGVAGLENYISSTDPFGNGNVKYVNDLTAADQTEVLAKGIFGTAKWYISMDGVLHIGAGEFAVANSGSPYSYDDSPWYGYADKIKKIVFDGDVVANANSSSLFGYLSHVTSIEGLNKLDTHQVTDMSGMFSEMSSLTSLDLSNFDTSQVTVMSGMFSGMSSLTSLDLSNFDTSQVTGMSSMFDGTSSLTNLDLSNFDTSQVTYMVNMFRDMSSLTSLNVSSFNTSQVKYMSHMFDGTSSLTSLDVSNFDTSQVINMNSMFEGMSGLTSLDVSNFDTSQVTDMSYMFRDISRLTSLDLSNFDTSKVRYMNIMFYGMSRLTSLDLSGFDTSQVTDMSFMFGDMTSLTSLDLSNFDTRRVTDMQFMFDRMPKLNQITFGANFDTSAAGYVDLPYEAGIKQWRQVGSGTVDKPAGAFRNSRTIDTTEPVVADTYVLTPTAKTEIVTTDTLSGSAKVGDAQTGAISQTGKLSFTVAGSDKGTITMALAKESSNVISGLHLASVKDDTEGTAKDYDITAGASTQIGTYSTSGTHNYSIDPSKSNIKLNSKSADPGSYTAATTYTMNNTPNA